MKILVIFLGHGSSVRTKDFVARDFAFEHVFLSADEFENRSLLKTASKLIRFLMKISYRRIVVGGWDQIEFWIPLFCSNSGKNSLALESTIHESNFNGIMGMIKKFFLSRVTAVFASGKLHADLLKVLGYQGQVFITMGVGLINPPVRVPPIKKYERKFLYLGRLSVEKNLVLLVKAFEHLEDHHLTLVGSGPMEDELKRVSPGNVSFVPHVDNKAIFKLFDENDFLILASTSETWGLVVEEALAHGRPVLISQKCGASELINGTNGMQFDPYSLESMVQTIRSIDEAKFNQFQHAIRGASGDFDPLKPFLISIQ